MVMFRRLVTFILCFLILSKNPAKAWEVIDANTIQDFKQFAQEESLILASSSVRSEDPLLSEKRRMATFSELKKSEIARYGTDLFLRKYEDSSSVRTVRLRGGFSKASLKAAVGVQLIVNW